jgi:hypothetical protein
VIDTSEPQPEKHCWPMTVIEAGKWIDVRQLSRNAQFASSDYCESISNAAHERDLHFRKKVCWSIESRILLNLVSENGQLLWLIDQITGSDGLLSAVLNRQSESADRGWFDNCFGTPALSSNRWFIDQTIEISVFSSLIRRSSVFFESLFRKKANYCEWLATSRDRMPINLPFLIEFSREIWGELSPTCGQSLIRGVVWHLAWQ